MAARHPVRESAPAPAASGPHRLYMGRWWHAPTPGCSMGRQRWAKREQRCPHFTVALSVRRQSLGPPPPPAGLPTLGTSPTWRRRCVNASEGPGAAWAGVAPGQAAPGQPAHYHLPTIAGSTPCTGLPLFRPCPVAEHIRRSWQTTQRATSQRGPRRCGRWLIMTPRRGMLLRWAAPIGG